MTFSNFRAFITDCSEPKKERERKRKGYLFRDDEKRRNQNLSISTLKFGLVREPRLSHDAHRRRASRGVRDAMPSPCKQPAGGHSSGGGSRRGSRSGDVGICGDDGFDLSGGNASPCHCCCCCCG